MDHKKQTILFFTYSFGYSGSEIMLLEFLKGLDREKFSPHLYLLLPGDLLRELPNDIPHYLPYRLKKGLKNWIRRKSISKKNNNYLVHQLTRLQRNIQADVWYINTIAVDPVIYKIANNLKVKIITHIHELTSAYSSYPASSLENIVSYSNLCIGCSKAVCQNLYEVGVKNVSLQYNFIDTDKIVKKLSKHELTRNAFNIEQNEFIWVVSSRTTYLKGINYLPHILDGLGSRKYKIIWVGALTNDALTYHVKTVIEKKYPGKVIFTNALTDSYYQHLALANGFLIPSKEESFSIVAIEAAFLGIPIVSFEYGAAKEVITPEIGCVVNSWNIEDLVKEMIILMDKTILDKPKEKNYDLPFTKILQMPKFNQLLAEWCN